MLQKFSSANPEIDLATLVEHGESVNASDKMEDVYRCFEEHGNKFMGVISGEKLIGLASGAKVGFLLGSRYGFSVYGRKPMRSHMLERFVCVRLHTPLLEVLDAALSREGDEFHDDVALVDNEGRYLGIIPMQRLVRLQSQLFIEKTRLAEEQQQVLAGKNEELFSSLNQLRQSKGRYDILFENSALGVALVNPSGEIEACNRHAESLLGMANANGDVPLLALMDTASRGEFLALLQRHEKQNERGSSSQSEFKLHLTGQGRRLFKFFSSWIKETGQVCVMLDDITEQRHLELKVAQEERSATLDTLAGGVAHEINNKLAPIVGFSELLLADATRCGKSPETVQYCNIIRDCAIDSSKIISQLLQLSRPASAEKQCCDLREIVEQVVAILRFQIRQSEAELVFNFSEQKTWVLADPGPIKQVIVNLIINSLQAVEKSGQRKVLVSVRGDEDTVTLEIEDTGHGIKPEHLKRVFDPFFTTKSFNRGTGLGLSICASIVRQHGGSIEIESTLGLGTIVKVELPAAVALPAAVGREQASAYEASRGDSVYAPRVLIVDDEEYVACAVQESLRSGMDWQVERVFNGLQAIERLQRNEFHLIISDVRMSGMDGFDLLSWVEKNCPDMARHFLFITGDAGSAELHEKLNSQGVPVLRKPFTVRALIAESQRLVKTQDHLSMMVA
ncbi:MAG: ATP-binding protein [Chthoniobacteraceae bacterium]